MALTASTTRWFLEFIQNNLFANGGLDGPFKLVGSNATGHGALTDTYGGSDTLADLVSGNRTHSVTALASPTLTDGALDFADLVAAFTDDDNANGDTDTIIILSESNASGESAELVGYVADPSGTPLAQDGNDDNVTFPAGGVLELGVGIGSAESPLVGQDWFWKSVESLLNGNTGTLAQLTVVGINSTGVTNLDYGFNGDEFLSDVTSTWRTHGPTACPSPTWAAGVLDCADVTLDDPNNGNGDTAALVYYLDTGTEATSRLLAFDVLGSAVAQDGVDDTLTIAAGGIATITHA